MIPINEAKEIIRRETVSLGDESVHLAEIVGRILAEDIFADMDLPPFDRSQMDGFAVRTEDVKDAPVELKIVGESVAGRGWHHELKTGEAVRIMTGAPVPDGADAVQKVELTKEADGFITIQETTETGRNIVRRAQEIKSGTKIFESGEQITENMVATLASFGYETVKAAQRPKVSILSTGSEIVDVSETPARDQIRNSNSWSLRAFALRYADAEILPLVRDDLETLRQTIAAACENCDVLIISGGVSVGDYDFTKPALRACGAEIFFEKVSLKPGKPTVFARLGETLVFGLPGNPVSSAVTFFVFVRYALLLMQNAKSADLKRGFAKLAHDINGAKGRDALLPVSLASNEKGELTVETLRFSGSSNFIRFAKADALVFVPRDRSLKAGGIAEIFHLRINR